MSSPSFSSYEPFLPLFLKNELRFYYVDDCRQNQYSDDHVHHHENPQQDPHLCLKTKRREARAEVAHGHHRRSEEDRSACSNNSSSHSPLQILLLLVDLNDTADVVEPVVDAEPDPEGDHWEGVDVQTDAFQDHVREGKEIGENQRHGEYQPGGCGAIDRRAKEENDRQNNEEGLVVLDPDDVIGCYENPTQPSGRSRY